MLRRQISLQCNILRSAFESEDGWLIIIRSTVYRKAVRLSQRITNRDRKMAGSHRVTAAVSESSIHNTFDLLFLSNKRKANIRYKQFQRSAQGCITGTMYPGSEQAAEPPTYLAKSTRHRGNGPADRPVISQGNVGGTAEINMDYSCMTDSFRRGFL